MKNTHIIFMIEYENINRIGKFCIIPIYYLKKIDSNDISYNQKSHAIQEDHMCNFN